LTVCSARRVYQRCRDTALAMLSNERTVEEQEALRALGAPSSRIKEFPALVVMMFYGHRYNMGLLANV